MYDILIDTACFTSTASIGSHNKDRNYGSIPLPRHHWVGVLSYSGWEAYFLDWVRESLRVASCSEAIFSKVVSPSNYNRAAVTMSVVRSQSRRYNPPLFPTT